MTACSGAVAAKAARYLASGRVTLLEVSPARVVAAVEGTAPAVHVTAWSPLTGWTCTCPATSVCAHLAAVQAVTARTPIASHVQEDARAA